MANVIANAPTLGIRIGVADRAEARSVAAIPWYVWCLVAGATSALIGGYWDISWHISIGRDIFWTPRTHGDLHRRRFGGYCLRLRYTLDNFRDDRIVGASQSGFGEHLGISRTARLLHRGLGRRPDADLGAVRQLVARRLRVQRQNL